MKTEHLPPRPEFVWSLPEIFAFFDRIEAVMSEKLNTDDGDAVSTMIADLLSLFSSSTNVCASASWYYEAALRAEYEYVVSAVKTKEIPPDLKPLTAPSVLSKYINARCADFLYIRTKADRVNALITHTLDALRSVLSKLKTDMQVQTRA